MNPWAIPAAIVGLLLLGGKAKAAVKKATKENPRQAKDDGAILLARATQHRAAEWVPDFEAAGASEALAEALSRWAGIESGGNALARSSLNERGLLQAGPQSVAEGLLTQAEWDAISDPSTSREKQAEIWLGYWKKLFERASHMIKSPPTTDIDKVWYAKLYHQRPAMLKEAKAHGPARLMSMALEGKWKGNGMHAHYLRSANVVAFGEPNQLVA